MIEKSTFPGAVDLIPLANSIQNWKEGKVPKHRIYLVEGKPMRRERIFGPIQRLVNGMPQDILLVRLDEPITKLEVGFNAHFTKLLAQEINRKEKISKEIREIVKLFLNPFEIEEETRRIGISWYIQIGKEQKLTKKTLDEEDIKQHCYQCLNYLQQEGWKVILLISSAQECSRIARQFLVKFLEDYPSSILLFGGPNEPFLSMFLDETGISDYYSFCYLNLGEQEEKKEEKIMYVAKAILDAFSRAPQHFQYFKFEQRALVEGKRLPGLAASHFNLAILGHLQMRHDNPRQPIRTNYDCAILISILKKPIESGETLSDLCDAAYETREGIEIEKDKWFEPWDTFLFLLVPGISDSALKSYRHQHYRNVFLLFSNGTFRNLSPHKWMDNILKEVSEQICRNKK